MKPLLLLPQSSAALCVCVCLCVYVLSVCVKRVSSRCAKCDHQPPRWQGAGRILAGCHGDTQTLTEGEAAWPRLSVCLCVDSDLKTGKEKQVGGSRGKFIEALPCGNKDTLEAQWRTSAGWSKWDATGRHAGTHTPWWLG